MRIGVFVGSFNPPHKGHISLVRHLIKEKIVDKVIIIPTLSYWNKGDLLNLEDRLTMLKYYENKDIRIDSEFSDRKYTYQILEELKRKYNDLYLIIGADNLIDFDKWKNIEKILENKVIVIKRNNIDIEKELEKFSKDNFIIVDTHQEMNISSTLIRELIRKNNKEDLNKYLDYEIIEYIMKKRLYHD